MKIVSLNPSEVVTGFLKEFQYNQFVQNVMANDN